MDICKYVKLNKETMSIKKQIYLIVFSMFFFYLTIILRVVCSFTNNTIYFAYYLKHVFALHNS